MNVLLDGIEPLEVSHAPYANEIRNLRTMSLGLRRLAETIKPTEMRFQQQTGGNLLVSMYGGTTPEEDDRLDLIACTFHWFGVTVCNYARLVGFIRGLDKGEFTRADLTDKSRFETIKQPIASYVGRVPELANVKVWRDKVSAHPAITDPRKDDNIATLDMSVIFPVSFENGLYVVGGMTLMKSNSTGSHQSSLPQWSLTQVFESLIPRYWTTRSERWTQDHPTTARRQRAKRRDVRRIGTEEGTTTIAYEIHDRRGIRCRGGIECDDGGVPGRVERERPPLCHREARSHYEPGIDLPPPLLQRRCRVPRGFVKSVTCGTIIHVKSC